MRTKDEEIRLLNMELAGANSRAGALKWEGVHLRWILDQLYRAIMEDPNSDLRLAQFIQEAQRAKDSDPALLEILKR